VEIINEGLKKIEGYADKKKDPQTLLICQCLREIREVKKELQDIRITLESERFTPEDSNGKRSGDAKLGLKPKSATIANLNIDITNSNPNDLIEEYCQVLKSKLRNVASK